MKKSWQERLAEQEAANKVGHVFVESTVFDKCRKKTLKVDKVICYGRLLFYVAFIS